MTRGKGKDEVKPYPLSLNPVKSKGYRKQVRSYEVCNNKSNSMYHNCQHFCNNRHYKTKIESIIDSKKTGKMSLVFLSLKLMFLLLPPILLVLEWYIPEP